MSFYTVRVGDTPRSIAKSCYGDGRQWACLAAVNPLAAAGMLYVDQRLAVPAAGPPGASLAAARPVARPLGHAAVRVRFDGRTALFTLSEAGSVGIRGMSGELIFHRPGRLPLPELSSGALLRYRIEQVVWSKHLFIHHFGQPNSSYDPGPNWNLPVPISIEAPGYSITGRVNIWDNIATHTALKNFWHANAWWRPTRDLDLLFDAAALVPAPVSNKAAPLGQDQVSLSDVLRASCPAMLTPSLYWVLTRDDALPLRTAATPVVAAPARGRGTTRARGKPARAKKAGRAATKKKAAGKKRK